MYTYSNTIRVFLYLKTLNARYIEADMLITQSSTNKEFSDHIPQNQFSYRRIYASDQSV